MKQCNKSEGDRHLSPSRGIKSQ